MDKEVTQTVGSFEEGGERLGMMYEVESHQKNGALKEQVGIGEGKWETGNSGLGARRRAKSHSMEHVLARTVWIVARGYP